MLIYTKGRELLEKDFREQEKADAEEQENQGQITDNVKPEPKQRSKMFRRFFHKNG